MQVFGKSLFERKQLPKLYDFAQHGILRMDEGYGDPYTMTVPQQVYAVGPGETAPGTKAKAKKKEAPKPQPTPKEIYVAKTLNTKEFSINTDPEYINTEVQTLKDKLSLYPEQPRKKNKRSSIENQLVGYGESGATLFGRQEVESMIERLTARKALQTASVKKTVDTWPHTTNDAIRAVLADNKHLEAIEISRMLPDMPKEAVDAMKAYEDLTKELQNKKPVFYLIREKQKERDVQRKRDPILLAQSPFGFFWQILGAWDKEVVLLDEL